MVQPLLGAASSGRVRRKPVETISRAQPAKPSVRSLPERTVSDTPAAPSRTPLAAPLPLIQVNAPIVHVNASIASSNAPAPTDAAHRPVGGSYTFGGRKGRISPTRQRALDELVPRYLFAPPFDASRPLIIEIGCGKGEATAAMAGGDTDSLVIACEPNAATIANLASLLDDGGITNVALWVGDAFDLLAHLGPASTAEIRVWFPDPWPKPRHAHKRLVTAQRLGLITDALTIGARLRIATDDAAYAEEALAAIGAEPRLSGGIVARPPGRPVTTFEARGLRAGHRPIDIEAHRIR